MKFIYLDIDGVIFDTVQTCLNILNKRYNTYFEKEQVKDYGFKDCFPNIDRKEIDDLFLSEEFFNNLILIKDAIYFLEKYRNRIVLFTKGEDKNIELKRKYFDLIGFSDIKIIGIPLNKSKGDYDLSDSLIFCDDVAINLKETNAPMKVLFQEVEETKWSLGCGVYTISNLKELDAFIEKNLEMLENDEIWKFIKDYDNEYMVSNYGNFKRVRDNLILKKHFDGKRNYLQVSIKNVMYLTHRLVAKAFIENPNNLPQVNHIDENKTNNIVSNLEWCTQEYNRNYGNCLKNMRDTKERNGDYKKLSKNNVILKGKKVNKYKLDGTYLETFDSCNEGGKSLFKKEDLKEHNYSSNVLHCCNGKFRQYKGYMWRFADEFETNKNIEQYKSYEKEVYQYDTNFNFIREWKSLNEVGEVLGFPYKPLQNCCRGYNQTSYGYIWRYKEDVVGKG